MPPILIKVAAIEEDVRCIWNFQVYEGAYKTKVLHQRKTILVSFKHSLSYEGRFMFGKYKHYNRF